MSESKKSNTIDRALMI